jgi:hypothetical protein
VLCARLRAGPPPNACRMPSTSLRGCTTRQSRPTAISIFTCPTTRPGQDQTWGLYRAAYRNDSYERAQALSFSDGEVLDADDPAIAPDQSYLIFGSHGLRPPLGEEHLPRRANDRLFGNRRRSVGQTYDGTSAARRPPVEQLRARVDRLADQGFRGVTISYDVWPDQVDTIVAEANRRELATIGELDFTSYPYAVRAGVGALLRNDQYLTELAPATAKLARADSLPAGAAAVRALCTINPASSGVQDYGDQLAHAQTALMPTLSMEATADLLDIPSPWTAKSSVLIKATDLDIPVDLLTGASGFLISLHAERRWYVRQCAFHKEMLDGQLYSAGAKFLAGSNAATYGILPGSGLHLELTLLHRIGLSPREALAAATSNYADVYGWHDVGRIEPGRVADLLLLDADPRTDVSAVDHIHTLVFKGAVVDRDALSTMSKTN